LQDPIGAGHLSIKRVLDAFGGGRAASRFAGPVVGLAQQIENALPATTSIT
jgi:hypothetical protein